jgi:hypothetical protein
MQALRQVGARSRVERLFRRAEKVARGEDGQFISPRVTSLRTWMRLQMGGLLSFRVTLIW